MNTLWSANQPLSGKEISKITPDITKGVVSETLTRLLKKKAIKINEIKIVNKSLTRFYQPLISEEDYFTAIVPERVLKKLLDNFAAKFEKEN